MAIPSDFAIQRVGIAIHAFQLQSSVGNIITMIDQLVDTILDLRACTDRDILGKNVSRHGP
jgi:hypothetical protein